MAKGNSSVVEAVDTENTASLSDSSRALADAMWCHSLLLQNERGQRSEVSNSAAYKSATAHSHVEPSRLAVPLVILHSDAAVYTAPPSH